MREYQVKRMKPYVLPEAVYRQALWAVKDLPRLRDALQYSLEIVDSLPKQNFEADRVQETTGIYKNYTERKAAEISLISMKIEAIEDALLSIPEKYRQGIWQKLTEGVEFGTQHHLNTWKKWQQVYIYYVAKNLDLY